jgi:putative transposase
MTLDELEAKWGDKYEKVIRSWCEKWHLLSAYFKYPKAVRKPMYTTNPVEAVHHENSLLKWLYMGIQQASEKWTMPVTNWGQTITQLSIYFEARLDDIIKL